MGVAMVVVLEVVLLASMLTIVEEVIEVLLEFV